MISRKFQVRNIVIYNFVTISLANKTCLSTKKLHENLFTEGGIIKWWSNLVKQPVPYLKSWAFTFSIS